MSDFKAKIQSNTTTVGTFLSELYSPNIPVLFKACGFDYFIVDCEHGSFDYAMVASLAAVAKNADIPMLVRIPAISREPILKYMDMGVDGIIAPMVSDAEEARRAVKYSKYAPLGERGVTTTRAHTGYVVGDLSEYMKKANQETVVLVQIENEDGLENIESITQTAGIDGIMAGPNDLASDMGIAGQLDNHMLKEAIQNINKSTLAAGLFSGIITSNLGLLKECAGAGMKLLSWNSELGMLMKSAKEGIKELKW